MSLLVHAMLVFGGSTACSRDGAAITQPGVTPTGEPAADAAATVPGAASSNAASSNAAPWSAVAASAGSAAPPASSATPPGFGAVLEDPGLPAGCLPVSPKDTFWDYPDERERERRQHPGARMEPTRPGAYRARVSWDPISSQGGAATQAETSGCLRVDVRTVDAEFWSTRAPSSLVLRAAVQADAPWELTGPARFAIPHPKLDTVYSFGVRAVCHAKPEACQAQAVTLWVEHPFPGLTAFVLPVKLAR
jgi:hypothetical protein